MHKTTREWLRLGALVAWVALALSVSLANACFDATGPKYPPPVDTTSKDTTKVGLLTFPASGRWG